MDKDTYYEGKGCRCYARSRGECACENVDWTPSEVYELRNRIVELEQENKELEECFDECYEELGKVQHELNKAPKEKGE